jgi:hypothetical protein
VQRLLELLQYGDLEQRFPPSDHFVFPNHLSVNQLCCRSSSG